jgi:hypothetical protein
VKAWNRYALSASFTSHKRIDLFEARSIQLACMQHNRNLSFQAFYEERASDCYAPQASTNYSVVLPQGGNDVPFQFHLRPILD